jgi:Zn ribbon nucleic-acid-binding protein
MGSVIDYIECPNCEQEAYSDFYYKTGEEYINCTSCGYHYSVTIKNRNKRLNELTEDDWEIVKLENPYGAYKIKTYEGVGYQCGSLENEQQLNELVKDIQQDNSVEYFQISRFVDGEIKTELIIDNGPKVDSAGFTIEDRE